MLITGAGRGIGAACARRFAEEGAHVAVGDVDEPAAKAVAAQLGEPAIALTLDVSDRAAFARAIERTVARFGRLDALVNNAGVASPSLPVEQTSDAQFNTLINVNLRGVFLGCQLAYPHLRQTQGCVLNMSSMAGVTGQQRHAVYAATKGAINALTKATAADWGPQGVRINALCPAGVWTDALRQWAGEQPNPEAIEHYLNRIHALNYCPQPQPIAAVAAFLCSEDARFITGAVMPASGGSECGYKL
jgi:NAD(P)-dependent dehydrogenase (short-subunit alcohol dehydrogenase family)